MNDLQLGLLIAGLLFGAGVVTQYAHNPIVGAVASSLFGIVWFVVVYAIPQ